MIFDKLSFWWRSLPQRTRVRLIASVLLIFAGTEVFILAPYIFELAVMIDVGGLVVVIAALQSSVSISLAQVRTIMQAILKPFLALFRALETAADFGNHLSPRWLGHYRLVHRLAAKFRPALAVLVVGLVLTRVLVAILRT